MGIWVEPASVPGPGAGLSGSSEDPLRDLIRTQDTLQKTQLRGHTLEDTLQRSQLKGHADKLVLMSSKHIVAVVVVLSTLSSLTLSLLIMTISSFHHLDHTHGPEEVGGLVLYSWQTHEGVWTKCELSSRIVLWTSSWTPPLHHASWTHTHQI